MKTKKLSLALILLAITIIVYIVASLLFSYTTQPKVTEGEFPFSITYEYNGEVGTLSGVFKCKYAGSGTILGEHRRNWDQDTIYDNSENLEFPFVIDQNDNQQITLALHENMSAGYFMGDPLEENYYEENGFDGLEPYVSYYDYANGIYLEGKSTEEVFESIDFKIVSFTYSSPIENSFSLSGIRYEADNIIIFAAIALAFLILCLIFIRKDNDCQYSKLDKFGVVFNFLIGLAAIPIVYLICMLFGLVESGIAIIDQIIYTIPPFAILCLALSVVFRRKGFSKTGFFMQFGGFVPFTVIFVLELIFRFH